jgi:nuclear receptor coactivator 2
MSTYYEWIFISDNATILNILDVIESSSNNTNSFQHDINEKMAISAIQKSLMQCETVVKSPSSPTISLSGTPPAYTPTSMSQQGSFPPPPLYPQRPRLNIQQAAGQLGVRPAGAIPYSNSQINNQVILGLL